MYRKVDKAAKHNSHPGYFLVRTTGEVVPLIAVDELPPGLDLLGAPRSLNLEATIGMLNLGLQRSSGSFYQIASNEGKALDSSNMAGKWNPDRTARSGCTAWRFPLEASSILKSKESYPPSHTAAHPENEPRSNHPTCKHWCTHGLCKWGQQCRYRHVMPMTLPGLQEVGLADWPTWYRALNPGHFPGREFKYARDQDSVGRGKFCGVGDGNSSTHENLNGNGNDRMEIRRRSWRRIPRDSVGENAEKKENLGDQVSARLRGMPRNREESVAGDLGKDVAVPRSGKRRSNALIKRDAEEIRNT